jgi:hypothetical protein
LEIIKIIGVQNYGLTSPSFCFSVCQLFFGSPENDFYGKEKSIALGKLVRVIAPLSSIGGIKPIARRF